MGAVPHVLRVLLAPGIASPRVGEQRAQGMCKCCMRSVLRLGCCGQLQWEGCFLRRTPF